MKKTIPTIVLILLAVSLVLSACSGSPAIAAAPATKMISQPTVSQVVTSTPVSTPTLSQIPEATRLPTLNLFASPEDPSGWTLPDGKPDPYQAGFILYPLSDIQNQMALRPVREFYDAMYSSHKLVTPDEAIQWFDQTSQAWTDPQEGFMASYESFHKVGYYPHYQYPVEDTAHYTGWDVRGVKDPYGNFHVVVNFKVEQQRFTVYRQADQSTVVTTPFWGPILVAFETAYENGRWVIINRHEDDLGIILTPTPTK